MITEQSIRQACNELAETLIAKNRDYGNSVQEQFDEYGEPSLLIRLDDKLRRLKQLQKAPANVKDESKQDTFLDLAGYAILGLLCLSSEEKYEPTQAELQIAQMWSPGVRNLFKKSPFEEQHDMNFNPHFDQDDQ